MGPSEGRAAGGELTLTSPFLRDPVGALPGMSRRPQPERAELKVGNLYLDLLSVSGSVLYSDNINLSPVDPESGTIYVTRLNAALFYVFSDRLQFGVAGSLIYLPRQGEVGIAGFGINDPLHAFARWPIFRAQLVYNALLGEWELEVFNDFQVFTAPDRVGGLGLEFEEEDRAGRYVFRDPFRRRGVGDSFLVLSNSTGGTAERLLPSDTRVRVGAHRTYWWYDDDGSQRQRPDWRDRGHVYIGSERENLRFKPYAWYLGDRFDNREWTHQARVGLHGPLNDYLSARAEAGYFWADASDTEGLLWLGMLRHTITPRTWQELRYSRSLTDPLQDLEETWSYRIRTEINSSMEANVWASRTEFELLDLPGSGGVESGLYAGVGAAVVPEGGVSVWGGYEETRYNNADLGSAEAWIARSRIDYRSWRGDLQYRYTTREAPLPNLNYNEHLVMFTLTRFL